MYADKSASRRCMQTKVHPIDVCRQNNVK